MLDPRKPTGLKPVLLENVRSTPWRMQQNRPGVCPTENSDRRFCAAPAFGWSAVPAGRHIVSHRFKRWETVRRGIESRRDGTLGWARRMCRPYGTLLAAIAFPPFETVGYDVSSLTGLAIMISAILRSVGQTPNWNDKKPSQKYLGSIAARAISS